MIPDEGFSYLSRMQLYPGDITSRRILISPLDWGMGHTTRCVPVIRQLIVQQNVIFFAGNKNQCSFIKREFPEINTVLLEGYGVTLDSQKSSYWQMLNQLSKIKKGIRIENIFAENFAEKEKIDIIISDNRYGFFSEKTQNIFLTHQLNLQLPFLKTFVNSQLKKWIEKFDCVWIPDHELNSICGDLLNADFKIPKIFIGLLCRFEKRQVELKYDYLGIVSGPEPERERFSKLLHDFLLAQNLKVALVGVNADYSDLDCFSNPTTSELENLINSSDCIVSRAGYTTIMEMILLEKNALLVPTPGQFEQEYLAKNVQSDFIIFTTEDKLVH